MNSWFKEWFNSPYYHVLYKKRDSKEAEAFLDTLLNFLKPPPGTNILDVACGRGRHAVYLNKLGFDITAFDLSPKNIEYDKQFENQHLAFYLHDMRETSWVNYFDYVFNLFTSFGYFEQEYDNMKTIQAHSASLKPHGTLVFDFMNAKKVIRQLPIRENKVINDISFEIKKSIVDDYIIKEIWFNDKGKEYHFVERLKIFYLNDFKKYFAKANLHINHIFGDYNLGGFDEKESERLILIAQKM